MNELKLPCIKLEQSKINNIIVKSHISNIGYMVCFIIKAYLFKKKINFDVKDYV